MQGPPLATLSHAALLEGSWYLLATSKCAYNPTYIIGITPIRPFRGTISRVINTVILIASRLPSNLGLKTGALSCLKGGL